MSLTQEAGYIYIYSKRLTKLNKKLKKLGKLAEKHHGRRLKAKEHQQEKHKLRHAAAVRDIQELMMYHDRNLIKLRTHYRRFAHYFRKEHKL